MKQYFICPPQAKENRICIVCFNRGDLTRGANSEKLGGRWVHTTGNPYPILVWVEGKDLVITEFRGWQPWREKRGKWTQEGLDNWAHPTDLKSWRKDHLVRSEVQGFKATCMCHRESWRRKQIHPLNLPSGFLSLLSVNQN